MHDLTIRLTQAMHLAFILCFHACMNVMQKETALILKQCPSANNTA